MTPRDGVTQYLISDGTPLRIGSLLARGGQGEVFKVLAQAGVVFKRLHESELTDDPTWSQRLQAMIANRPEGWQEKQSGHILLAWPTAVIFDKTRFTGFLMPAIDVANTVELHEVANPSDRRIPRPGKTWTRNFTWKYLVMVGANLALATQALHRIGVVIGDFNERNILVWSDARVTLLDCDSMQIVDPVSGRRFLCSVGRPEFTAPELLGLDLNTHVRVTSSDLFALAIHIHQLLLEGAHPFDGVWTGPGEKPRRHTLARDGTWVHGGNPLLVPPPSAVDIHLLPSSTISLFTRAFVDGAAHPAARPSAREWREELLNLSASLITCVADSAHAYPGEQRACPWCARAAPLIQTPVPVGPARPNSHGLLQGPLPQAPLIPRRRTLQPTASPARRLSKATRLLEWVLPRLGMTAVSAGALFLLIVLGVSLFRAGEAVVSGVANGVGSAATGVSNGVGSAAHWVSGIHLPSFSSGSAAPGSTAPNTTSPATVSDNSLFGSAAQGFYSAVTAYNTFYDDSANRFPDSSASASQARAFYTRLVVAERAFVTRLRAITFPTALQADANMLISANMRVISAAEEAAKSPAANSSAVEDQVLKEASAARAASFTVRHDFGLPTPPP